MKQREGGITWTDATWNPIRGCSRVSEGCRNCYAERVAYRFSGPGQPYEGLVRINAEGGRQPQWNGTVRVVEDHMLDPIRWKGKPLYDAKNGERVGYREGVRVFVNSMSDLFHENVSDQTIDRVFAVMALCPQHQFQVLTKRSERMLHWFQSAAYAGTQTAAFAIGGPAKTQFVWPLPNVWLGVSVEDQAAADARIPLLLQTPAAVRWISAEPLLGPIDVRRYMWPTHWHWDSNYRTPQAAIAAGAYAQKKPQALVLAGAGFLNWVVVGGESGPGARPMEEAWARSLRDQCVAAGIPFHFKQWGEWLPAMCDGAPIDGQELNCSDDPIRVGKHKAGRLLDGREWNEFPDIRRTA